MVDTKKAREIEFKIFFKDLEKCTSDCSKEIALEDYCHDCAKEVRSEHRAEWSKIKVVQDEIAALPSNFASFVSSGTYFEEEKS